MYKGMRILTLITARGGSKGIPRKNIRQLGAKPLLVWTIEAGRESRYIDRLVLSSEDDEIISVAEEAGCEVPFRRPRELAGDESSSVDVVMHALDVLGERYDYLLLLQPTSPFRTASDIDRMIEECLDRDCRMMISVRAVKKHPSYMFSLESGYLKPLLGQVQQQPRQALPPVYEHTGAMYLANIDYLRDVRTFLAPEAVGFETTGPANLDIDDFDDWRYAEYIVSIGKVA